ncbi:MAG: methyltransferase domain-containing protein [Bryobacter sp.]
MVNSMTYKQRVETFYDKLSPHFRDLWGEHLHDGYYETGLETKEAAQEKLVAFLADFAQLPRDAAGLDIGCGMGATSVWLAKHLRARMTGLTLSGTQVEIARELAARESIQADFRQIDAEAFQPELPFDFAWMVGVLGHFENQRRFVQQAARYLKPGGTFLLADWTSDPLLHAVDRQKYVNPVLEGMLMPDITSLEDYTEWFGEAGFRVLRSRDITQETLQTWDEGVNILEAPGLARMAIDVGWEAVRLISAVRGMRTAMSRGHIRYGILVAERL